MKIALIGATGFVGAKLLVVAKLDEAERPQHHRQRFTVAY